MTTATRRLIHKGRKFDFEMVNVRLPSGRTVEREVVGHPGAVVIVPLLDDNRIALIRNYRIALDATLFECPAGTLEPPEPPESCASRELIEETGFRAATIIPLGWFYTTPGLTDEKMFAFVAKDLTPVGQDLQDDECITVSPVPVDEAFAMIDRGEIADAKSILSLLLARRRGLV